jgi:hypothetical protein
VVIGAQWEDEGVVELVDEPCGQAFPEPEPCYVPDLAGLVDGPAAGT